ASWSGNSTNDWNVPALPAPGSYTIVVDLTGQANMALTLTLSDDILVYGSSGSQALQPRSGQNVRFIISGVTGQHLTLSESGSNVACCVAVKLLDASGAQIGSSGSWSGTPTNSWNAPTLPANGVYTIFVDLPGQAGMALTLTLDASPGITARVTGLANVGRRAVAAARDRQLLHRAVGDDGSTARDLDLLPARRVLPAHRPAGPDGVGEHRPGVPRHRRRMGSQLLPQRLYGRDGRRLR